MIKGFVCALFFGVALAQTPHAEEDKRPSAKSESETPAPFSPYQEGLEFLRESHRKFWARRHLHSPSLRIKEADRFHRTRFYLVKAQEEYTDKAKQVFARVKRWQGKPVKPIFGAKIPPFEPDGDAFLNALHGETVTKILQSPTLGLELQMAYDDLKERGQLYSWAFGRWSKELPAKFHDYPQSRLCVVAMKVLDDVLKQLE